MIDLYRINNNKIMIQTRDGVDISDDMFLEICKVIVKQEEKENEQLKKDSKETIKLQQKLF